MSEAARIAAIVAPEGLRRFVAGAWRVEARDGHAVHTAPDGSIDIVLASNEAFDGVFVCGPARTFTKRSLKGETRLSGVSLRPGFAALVGVSADALPADWTALPDLQLPGPKPSLREGVAGLFQFIAQRAESARFDVRVGETIARMLRGRGNSSVTALAREAGLSERSLGRLFERHVGMPPAAYQRILRFNRALSRLRAARPERLADIALALGFADQSHMARDLRELGGITATELMRREPLELMSPSAVELGL
jgi:AraC-like DNA-binding protein